MDEKKKALLRVLYERTLNDSGQEAETARRAFETKCRKEGISPREIENAYDVEKREGARRDALDTARAKENMERFRYDRPGNATPRSQARNVPPNPGSRNPPPAAKKKLPWWKQAYRNAVNDVGVQNALRKRDEALAKFKKWRQGGGAKRAALKSLKGGLVSLCAEAALQGFAGWVARKAQERWDRNNRKNAEANKKFSKLRKDRRRRAPVPSAAELKKMIARGQI